MMVISVIRQLNLLMEVAIMQLKILSVETISFVCLSFFVGGGLRMCSTHIGMIN